MKLIKTWEEYCEKHGIDPNQLPDVSMYPEQHRAAAIAQYKLWLMSKDINGDWNPNWKDSNQYKYFPYFDMNDDEDPAGFGFSGATYDIWSSGTAVGSRLCYETRDKAEYAGKQFIELYRDLMVLPG